MPALASATTINNDCSRSSLVRCKAARRRPERRGWGDRTFRAKSGGDQPESRLQQGSARSRLSRDQRYCNSLIRNSFWGGTARFHTKGTITPKKPMNSLISRSRSGSRATSCTTLRPNSPRLRAASACVRPEGSLPRLETASDGESWSIFNEIPQNRVGLAFGKCQQDVSVPGAVQSERLVQLQIARTHIEPRRVDTQ